tara:strand:- start:317 stop:844 length:528 start_codon:yes stop_codon:yes gene_type:complete
MSKLEKFFYINTTQKIDFDYIKKIKAALIIKCRKGVNLKRYIFIKKECNSRRIPLFISNDIRLLYKLGVKNFYISAYNKKKYRNLPDKIYVIGSAHNVKEIREKISQGCKKIILSRLFDTYKKGCLGVLKFNLISQKFGNIIALGGIKTKNIKALKMINVVGAAIKSDIDNKPFT